MAETRGRKPLKVPEVPRVQLNESAINEALEANRALARVEASFTTEKEMVHQAVGRAQALMAVGSFTKAISLQTLKAIKDAKQYRELKGRTGIDRHGQIVENLGTWDGFCRALGMSSDKVDEDLANLDAFGEDALDRLSALGAGYRDLRQYRKLPDDSKQALIEVAKLGDKEGFVELAEQIISKHAKEKEVLQKAVEDGKQEMVALEKRLGVLRQQREDAEEKDARFAALGPDGQLAELQKAATDVARRAWVTILQLEAAMLKVQSADPGAAPFLAGLLKRVSVEIARVEEDLQLPSVSDIPAGALEWLEHEAAQAKMQTTQ